MLDKSRTDKLFVSLAVNYDKKDLKSHELAYPWLQTFKSRHPDLITARQHFLKDGIDCIGVLEKHFELCELASINGYLTRSSGNEYPIFMSRLFVKYQSSFGVIRRSEHMADGTRRFREERDKRKRTGVEGSADDPDNSAGSFLEAAQVFSVPAALGTDLPDENLYSLVSEALRKTTDQFHLNPGLDGSWFEYLKEKATSPEATCKMVYYKFSLRQFTKSVGCPKAHDEPEHNISELRRFNSTQMPFFAKIQSDLQAQIQENNNQKEIITALTFRHLLEKLPHDKTRGGETTSTARWREFWEDAARKMIGNPHSNHPLQGVIPLNALTKKDIFSPGEKGHLFRTGCDLYGTLSKNIHGYKGGGRNGYDVRDDQWGLAIRQILKALIPKEFDPDGEVDWDKERARYL